MTETLNCRLGEIEYDTNNVISIESGIIGFKNLKKFIVVPIEDGSNFNYLQSVEQPEVSFIVTDPTKFYPDYQIQADNSETETLGIQSADDCFAVSIVNIQNHIAYLNLAAPILIAPKKQTAMQTVVEKFSHLVHVPMLAPKKGHHATVGKTGGPNRRQRRAAKAKKK